MIARPEFWDLPGWLGLLAGMHKLVILSVVTVLVGSGEACRRRRSGRRGRRDGS
ncbi:hypothetical protein ABZV14_27410 [Streptosporangium canum]|uniref:hypothetical protein n=1 Tax=Streptosporangium canum TaxID=324952 RepID=UPI0033B3B54E